MDTGFAIEREGRRRAAIPEHASDLRPVHGTEERPGGWTQADRAAGELSLGAHVPGPLVAMRFPEARPWHLVLCSAAGTEGPEGLARRSLIFRDAVVRLAALAEHVLPLPPTPVHVGSPTPRYASVAS